MQVCYQLDRGDKYLIPSRVEKQRIDPSFVSISAPLTSVRLKCPDGCVIPPGYFAHLMCCLGPPFNYAGSLCSFLELCHWKCFVGSKLDEGSMFATHEFMVLDKAMQNKTFVMLDASVCILLSFFFVLTKQHDWVCVCVGFVS